LPQSKTKELTVSLSGYESAPGYGAVPPPYANVTISNPGAVSGSIQPTVLGPFTTGTGVNPWATNTNITGGKITLEGEDADIDVNGKSLVDTLKALEERLNILVPNQELEKEWNELKRLGDQYRQLEADLKEKAAMWKALKAEDR